MDCKRAKGLIVSDYADGVLRGHALEELESHLNSCSSCRAFAGDIASAGKLFRSAGRLEAPSAVWDRVRAGVSVSFGKPGPSRTIIENVNYGFHHLRPAFLAIAAVVLLVFAITAARIVIDRNSYMSALAGEEIMSMISLNNMHGNGEYDMGTSVETFLL